MRFLFRLIRNVLLFGVIIVLLAIIWFNGFSAGSKTDETVNGATYSLEDNALFKNIPLSQVKNVFDFMDKQEFMAVSGLSRMGYNDTYLAGERGANYILYKFGDKRVRVFNSEAQLNAELNGLNQQIALQDKSAY